MDALPDLTPTEAPAPSSKLKLAMMYSSPVVNTLFWMALIAIIGVAILIGHLLPN